MFLLPIHYGNRNVIDGERFIPNFIPWSQTQAEVCVFDCIPYHMNVHI